MVAQKSPITGAELVEVYQQGSFVLLNRLQMIALMALPNVSSFRPFARLGPLLGSEQVLAIQNGQEILLSGADLAAFLTSTGPVGSVPPERSAGPLSGAERVTGQQQGEKVSFNLTELGSVRVGGFATASPDMTIRDMLQSFSIALPPGLSGGSSVPPPVPTPAPSFTVQPSISPYSGTVGAAFTVSSGAVTNGLITGYQWRLGGTAISGATSASYTSAVVGTLTCDVIATGPGGSTTATATGVTVTSGAAYLPTVVSGGTPLVYGAKRMVAGYSGKLFTLTRASDATTLDVYSKAGSDLPDYSAVSSFGGGTTLTVTTWYDQNGSANNFTFSGATTAIAAPSFDVNELQQGGAAPILWDGVRAATPTSGSVVAKVLSVGGLSLNRTSMSIVDVCAARVSLVDNTFWVGTDGESTGNNYVGATTRISAQAGREQFCTPAAPAYGIANSAPRVNPDVYVDTYRSNGVEQHVRGQVLSGTVSPSSQAIAMILLGRRSGSNPTTSGSLFTYNSTMRRWGFIIYPQALATADATTVRQALYGMFSVPTTFTSRVVFDGNSIIEGNGCQLKTLTGQLLALLTSSVEMFNMGVGGQTLATMNTNVATRMQPLATTAYGAGKCIAIAEGGINDIRASGTGANTYSTMSSYVSSVKGYGYVTGITTLTPATDGNMTSAMQTERTNYNTAVNGKTMNPAADFIVDNAANTVMGPAAAPNDATLYVDKLHPSALGQSYLIAQGYRPALAAQGVS